jgi:hypothetical protein
MRSAQKTYSPLSSSRQMRPVTFGPPLVSSFVPWLQVPGTESARGPAASDTPTWLTIDVGARKGGARNVVLNIPRESV